MFHSRSHTVGADLRATVTTRCARWLRSGDGRTSPAQAAVERRAVVVECVLVARRLNASQPLWSPGWGLVADSGAVIVGDAPPRCVRRNL